MGFFAGCIAFVLASIPAAQGASVPEVLDRAFGPIWALRSASWEEAEGREGPVAVLHGLHEDGVWSHVGTVFEAPPVERELTLSVFARGVEPSQSVSINTFAYAASGEIIQTWTEPSTIGADWVRLQRRYVLPPGTVKWTLFVLNHMEHDVRVAEARVTVGAPARALIGNLAGPGVIRATANTMVRAREEGQQGRVRFPIPLLTEHQVPLTFDLEVEPSDALVGFRWVPRDDGTNWLCEVEVAPIGDMTRVRWTSLVLVDDRLDVELPRVERAAAPEELQDWLRSTACIQSAEQEIQDKAAALWSDASELGEFVEGVIGFTSTHKGTQGGRFFTLDAKVAMACGGSCTSRANLAAALFRAGGVPARTSAHLPTWSGPLYEHWHVEYWHPGAGWVWVEPTLGRVRPKPYSFVVLNVASPDDEDESFDPVFRHSGVMPGAPRYSVHEHSEDLKRPTFSVQRKERELNVATAVARLSGDASERATLFAAARAAWRTLADSGQAGKLDAASRALIEAAVDQLDATPALLEALEAGSAHDG